MMYFLAASRENRRVSDRFALEYHNALALEAKALGIKVSPFATTGEIERAVRKFRESK
jgi:hypothetical protein